MNTYVPPCEIYDEDFEFSAQITHRDEESGETEILNYRKYKMRALLSQRRMCCERVSSYGRSIGTRRGTSHSCRAKYTYTLVELY